jgi:DNA-binding transcriptional MerR regulator
MLPPVEVAGLKFTRVDTSSMRKLIGADMDKECRAHFGAGVGQAGDDTQTSLPSKGFTVAELASEAGITVRALRFYQSKGLLAPRREGNGRVFNQDDRDSLAFILRGKRLGFTLAEIREMLLARARGFAGPLPINRRKCVEQIAMLEKQLREIDSALAELRQIYAEMFDVSRGAPSADTPGAR